MTPVLLSLSMLAASLSIRHESYGSDPKQKIDITTKDEAKGLPVVVFLHGGVWQLGDRTQFAHVGTAFATRGFVAVTASYRLAPRHRWPAQIEDAAAVVAFVHENAAKWGGDPEKLFVVGHSAGGQLAMMMLYDPTHLAKHKLTPANIKGVVALSGVFDLRAPLDEDQDDGGFARFVAPVFGADLKALRAASPIDAVKKTGIPLLFITSTADYAAMRAQTEQMARALALLGEKVPVVVVDGPDHFALVTQIGEPGDKVTDEVTRFLRR
jgi:acetyl esterase/lipase